MYEEHFGLSAKPFQLSPDAAFFFPSKEHQRALSFLEYGLDQADGFIVITGDVGTGKDHNRAADAASGSASIPED